MSGGLLLLTGRSCLAPAGGAMLPVRVGPHPWDARETRQRHTCASSLATCPDCPEGDG